MAGRKEDNERGLNWEPKPRSIRFTIGLARAIERERRKRLLSFSEFVRMAVALAANYTPADEEEKDYIPATPADKEENK